MSIEPAMTVNPPITYAKAKAAYNTLRDYCKQSFNYNRCIGCCFSKAEKCVIQHDADNGYTMPADWSGE